MIIGKGMKNEQILIVGQGNKLFRITFTLDPKVWAEKYSTVFVRANDIADVTWLHLNKVWDAEIHCPFGLESKDIIAMNVVRE